MSSALKLTFLAVLVVAEACLCSQFAFAKNSPVEACGELLESLLIPGKQGMFSLSLRDIHGSPRNIWGILRAYMDLGRRRNLKDIDKLDALPMNSDSPPLPPVSLLQTVWQNIVDHPVAALCHLPEYDPAGDIGFCFGRAMAAHLEAMVQNIDEVHIKKVFTLGDFRNIEDGDKLTTWHYHVTTAVRADDGRWYAIDPRMSGPIPIGAWARHWESYAVDELSFRVAHARTLYPQGHRYYEMRLFDTEQNLQGNAQLRFLYLRRLGESFLTQIKNP